MAGRPDQDFSKTEQLAPAHSLPARPSANERPSGFSPSSEAPVGRRGLTLFGLSELDSWTAEETGALPLPPASMPEHDWRELPSGPDEHEIVVRGPHNRPQTKIVLKSLARGGGELWEGLGLPGARRSDYRRCRSVQQIPAGYHDGMIDGVRVDELMGEGAEGDPREEFLQGGGWHVDSGPTGNAPGRPETTTKSPDAIEGVALLALQASHEVVPDDPERALRFAGVALFLVRPAVNLREVADQLEPAGRGYSKSALYGARQRLQKAFS
jgi:hypothetical protein